MNVQANALVYAMDLEREISDLRWAIHRLNSLDENSRDLMVWRIKSLGNKIAKEARMLAYVVSKTPPIDKSSESTP